MKKIAIVELYDHYEVVRDLARVIDVKHFELSIFIQRKYKDDNDRVQQIGEWSFESGDTLGHGVGLNGILKNYDLVLVTTLATHFEWWRKILLDVTYCIILHNIDPMLRPYRFRYHSLDVTNLLRRLKSLTQIRAKRALISNAVGVTFLSQVVLAKAKEVSQERVNLVEVPPLRSYMEKELDFDFSDDRLVVVIPSTVRAAGRDYQVVYEALRALGDRLTEVRLVLLGKAGTREAQKIVLRFAELRSMGLDLVSFDRFVETQVYDKYFGAADLAICPYANHQQVGPYRSRVGQEMCSGVMQDLVRYGKVALLPKNYKIDEELSEYVQFYSSSSEIKFAIMSCIKNPPKSPVQMHGFDIQGVRERLTLWMKQWVD